MQQDLTPVLAAIGLAVLVVFVTAFARRLPVPVPILQVIAGLLVGLLPGIDTPKVEPEFVFLVILPPVLWSAAYFTSLREFRTNLRPIGLLAVGLVVTTTVIVALAAHALLPGISWAAAAALGAIVSPPDAVAAEAIIKRLPVPRRVIVILEGESLVNDASALILYRTAVVAAVTGYFSMGEAVVRFFIDALVGVMVGLLLAWLIIWAARATTDALTEILLTLLGPYVAWVGAELVHASAVLAVVAGGIYVRQHLSSAVAPTARLQSRAVWDLIVFILNALIFLLLGMQFGDLVGEVPRERLGPLVGIGLAVSAIVILVRLTWVPIATALPRLLSPTIRAREARPPAKAVFLIGWTSMRGIVSLASALALPILLQDGAPFPYRMEIIFITMCVIMVTLVVQGATLTPLIRRFNFPPDHVYRQEEQHARTEAIRQAIERIEDLAEEPWVRAEDVEQLTNEYRQRQRLHTAPLETDGADASSRHRLRAEALQAERRALIDRKSVV